MWRTRPYNLQRWLMLAQAIKVRHMAAIIFFWVYHIWFDYLFEGHQRFFCIRNIKSISSWYRYSFFDFSISHWWFQYYYSSSNSLHRNFNYFLAYKVLHDKSRQGLNKRIRHFNVSFHFIFHLCTNLFVKLCCSENVSCL